MSFHLPLSSTLGYERGISAVPRDRRRRFRDTRRHKLEVAKDLHQLKKKKLVSVSMPRRGICKRMKIAWSVAATCMHVVAIFRVVHHSWLNGNPVSATMLLRGTREDENWGRPGYDGT